MQSISVSDSIPAMGGIVPALRYRDVRAASLWLCNAFGFEEDRAVADADGTVRYVQLACGASRVMLCPVGGTAFDTYMVQPADVGSRETQACYVFVPDVLAHKSRALEAGAELVIDIDAGDGRGQGYSCRDFEGHIWSFGTFDPWRGARAEAPRPAGASPAKLAGLVCAAVVVTALATTALLSWLSPERSLAASLAEIEDVLEKPVDLAGAERLLQQARTDLARERALRMRAERASAEVTGRRSQPPRLAQRSIAEREAEADMVAADRPVREARVSLDARREVVMFPTAKPAAAKPCPMEVGSLPVRVASSAAAGRDELDALRRAVALAQAQLKEEHDQARSGSASLRNQLERERSARESAERAAREARLRVARIEALRRAEHEKRNAFGGYRDISGEIFPASR